MTNSDNENSGPEDFERFMRQFLESGNLDPSELAKVAGLGIDPAQISAIMSALTSAFTSSANGVNWDLAKTQALAVVRNSDREVTESEQQALNDSFQIATLWLTEATELTTNLPPKHYTRGGWIQDAVGLFRELAEPIASSMGRALTENLSGIIPANEEIAQNAAGLIKNAGAAIFAMQLGQNIGKLASEAIAAGEIGIPVTGRPGIIFQNLKEYAKDLEVPISELTIYFALRELAISALFSNRPWLREQIVSQIREYSSGLTVDVQQIQNLAESYDPENPTEFTFAIEQGALITPRTPEQEQALARIEFLLALIEGWVEAVSLNAAKRMSKTIAISEAIRRRRVSGGAAEKTFATLLGLELRPRLAREALSFWQELEKEMGSEARDQVWSHPDLVPSQAEVANPELAINRLRNNGDDMDQALRDLLS